MRSPLEPSPPVLRALPRRSALRAGARRSAAPPEPVVLPGVGPLVAARRATAWLVALLALELAERLDGLRGRDPAPRRLDRLRAATGRMGPASTRLALQLAYRIDLLPRYATALGQLQDEAPPFDIAEAVARVEADLGRPLAEVFEALDPEPIASGALDCKYQARLLPAPGAEEGAGVVVRVRRPGARRAVAEQLVALGGLLRGLELTATLRPGGLEHLRDELSAGLGEELDFRVQARYQALLRRRLRKDRLRHVQVPALYPRLLSGRVMVSGFVSGIRLSELIVALEDPTPERQALLGELGADPAEVARTLLEYGWWCLFENDFFHSAADPERIVVTPGGGLGLVEFGHFTTAQGRTRRLLRELVRRMSLGEVSGAAEVVVQALTPLPFIDTHTFTRRLEARLWQQYFAMKDPESPPAERSSAGLWRAILEVAAEDAITVHQDLANMLRALVAFEELALRLDPRLRLLREFRRYSRRAQRRRAQRFARRLQARGGEPPAIGVFATADRALRLADRMTFLTETLAENLPVANLSLPSKASTVASELVSYGVRLTGLWVVCAMGYAAWSWRAQGAVPPPAAALAVVAASPPLVTFAALMLLVTLRRCQFRLQDRDPDT